MAANTKSRRTVLKLLLALGGLALRPTPARARTLAAPAVGTNRLRPPGAVMEQRYPGKCIRCGRCAEVCPYHCIRLLDLRDGLMAGTPIIEVEQKPCYLCMKCVHVCPTGALTPLEQQQTRMGLAVIDQHSCVSWRDEGLMCKTCYNVCPFIDRAVTFDQYRPTIDAAHCTGCGICTYSCPITRPDGRKAINIAPVYSSIRLPETPA